MTFHIRDAFKSLRRDPAFCITVILTLALATGATAGIAGALAMGSIVASLLFGVRARDPLVIAGSSLSWAASACSPA
ncbi:MAG TPA: hypothetical protein VEL51_07135 [Vicinamibacterales bacterium]|nr:hypothetical protein [Vicinamibacterales bacterium]